MSSAGNLGLDNGTDIETIVEESVSTPAPKKTTNRRRARRVETPESISPVKFEPVTPCTTRLQRSSKTAALGRMKCQTTIDIDNDEEIDEDELKFISKTSSDEDQDSTDTDYVAEGDEIEGTTGKQRLTQAVNPSDDEIQNENSDCSKVTKDVTCDGKDFSSEENSSLLQTSKRPSRSALVAFKEDSDYEAFQKTPQKSTRKKPVKSARKAI